MTPPQMPPVVDAPQRWRVKYSLTRGDILRWQFGLQVQNRVLIVLVLTVSLGLAWNDLRAPEMAALSIGLKILFVVFFTFIMFLIIAFVTMVLSACMVICKKYRGFLGEHELEIRDDGLIERTDVNETLHRWAGFHKVVTTRRYLYIYVTDVNVHIVPRHYFASEQEESAFRNEILRHLSAA